MEAQKILFIGDSLIEFFDWQARFSQHRVVNLGRSGETVQELSLRSKKVTIAESGLDWIFVMIGTNNVVMGDYSFLPSYEKIIDTLAKKNFQPPKLWSQVFSPCLFPGQGQMLFPV